MILVSSNRSNHRQQLELMPTPGNCDTTVWGAELGFDLRRETHNCEVPFGTSATRNHTTEKYYSQLKYSTADETAERQLTQRAGLKNHLE